MTPQQREAAVDQALAAKQRLDRLKRSPDFLKRYAAEDPDAVDAVTELTHRMAAGMDIAKADLVAFEAKQYNVPITPDRNVDAAAKQAHDQAVQALVSNPDFVKRYHAGDAKALAQWKEVSVDGAAAMLGVDPNGQLPGQASPKPAQSVQPDPAAVGSVSTGGA